MKYSDNTPVIRQPGLSEKSVSILMNIMSERDGMVYTSFTFLSFSRPAVCIASEKGEQKTITIDNAKQIMKEERHD